MRNNKINMYYKPEMAFIKQNNNFSKSPEKPRLLVEFLKRHGLYEHFNEKNEWLPFEINDFLIAHDLQYVNDFFNGVYPRCVSNGLEWSYEFSQTVRYTNASLYYAILASVENPSVITFSPTSGFHHATPYGGCGFCTFSGQVIASMKLFRQKKLRGAYIDLDGHFGNSIEDSREFVGFELDLAIPRGLNINPVGTHKSYLKDLSLKLNMLKEKILNNEVDYVVFCHGADSHEWDDLGGQCTTAEWLECSKIVYNMILEVDKILNRPFPLTLALFGGYRKDDYESVLNLHAADLSLCLEILCNVKTNFIPKINPPTFKDMF